MTNKEKFLKIFGFDGSLLSKVLPGTHDWIGSCGYRTCSESCGSRYFPRCPHWWNDEAKPMKNKDWLATLSEQEFYDRLKEVEYTKGKMCTDTRMYMISWLEKDHDEGEET